MTVKKILLLGDERLYHISKNLTEADKTLAEAVAKDLEDTLLDFRQKNGFGRAIAAPQIGKAIRMIYMNLQGNVTVFVNPVLSFPDPNQFELWDDCMSFPDLEVLVRRYKTCHVTYLNLNFELCEITFNGDLSELFQHEYDHLDGILATQRALSEKGFRVKTATVSKVYAQDADEVKFLFKTVLEDLYKREGILERFQEELNSELETKSQQLDESIKIHSESQGSVQWPLYLMAKKDGKCVGTIALTSPNHLITDHLDTKVENLAIQIPEVSSVLVLPEYQGSGIGVRLLEAAKTILKDVSLNHFYLDCGYTQSQPYWKRQLGEPTLVLEHFWDEGIHHMIWDHTI